MKSYNTSVIRSISAIVLGLVLILWPEATITYLVMIIGILFIIPGIISTISYFLRSKEEYEKKEIFPIEAAGSILLGAWLVITPEFFVNILMYVLGAILVVAGLHQLISLITVRKWTSVPFGFYLMPTLTFIAGIMILAYPFGAAANTFVIFGITSLYYGCCEFINWYKFQKQIKNTGL